MSLQRFTYAERPDLAIELEKEADGAFPEFLLHDQVWNRCWPEILERFPELQYTIYDPERDQLVGGANAVPISWNGEIDSLPTYHEALLSSIENHKKSIPANTICGIQAVAVGERRGTGLSDAFVAGAQARSEAFRFEHAVTPLRMLLKQQFPLVPLKEYVRWRRPDGEPFEPWVRIWLRAGAEVLTVREASTVIVAPLDEWSSWTGLEFPGSGSYVIEGGHAPLSVDVDAGVGRYLEPHLWIKLPSG